MLPYHQNVNDIPPKSHMGKPKSTLKAIPNDILLFQEPAPAFSAQ